MAETAAHLVIGQDQIPNPDGIRLLTRLQEALRDQHGPGPGGHGSGRQPATCTCSTSGATTRYPTASCSPTSWSTASSVACIGARCDVDGNVWGLEQRQPRRARARLQRRDRLDRPRASSSGGSAYPGVCGNLCFGGPKRNRLFMAASQSLYALYVNTQGAAPA